MKKQFSIVDSAYGAPMGRATSGTAAACEPRTVRLFRVVLIDGYDDGGAYWGANSRGSFLYCATDGAGYREFTRAASRADAATRLGVPTDRLVRTPRELGELRARAAASEQHSIAQALRAGAPIPGMSVNR